MQEDPSSILINYVLKSRVGYGDGEYLYNFSSAENR